MESADRFDDQLAALVAGHNLSAIVKASLELRDNLCAECSVDETLESLAAGTEISTISPTPKNLQVAEKPAKKKVEKVDTRGLGDDELIAIGADTDDRDVIGAVFTPSDIAELAAIEAEMEQDVIFDGEPIVSTDEVEIELEDLDGIEIDDDNFDFDDQTELLDMTNLEALKVDAEQKASVGQEGEPANTAGQESDASEGGERNKSFFDKIFG